MNFQYILFLSGEKVNRLIRGIHVFNFYARILKKIIKYKINGNHRHHDAGCCDVEFQKTNRAQQDMYLSLCFTVVAIKVHSIFLDC